MIHELRIDYVTDGCIFGVVQRLNFSKITFDEFEIRITGAFDWSMISRF